MAAAIQDSAYFVDGFYVFSTVVTANLRIDVSVFR